ncbi:hypothetical protein ACFVWF_31330 [Rhodococcus qingshengii]|uniref:hypothetical protein n=1 Tax=Rhodococcus qingshengii TaxID=334542 RepID=UPI0036DCF81B
MTEPDHLTNWTATGWLGGIAVLILAGLLGAAAVFLGRVTYWYSARDVAVSWWRLAASLVLWAVSIRGLVHALGALARHSRSTEFFGTTGLISVAVIAAGYMVAANLANGVCEDIARFKEEPGWLPATWIVPALSVFVVFVVTQVGEITARELWDEVLRNAIVLGALLVLFFLGLVWLYARAKERNWVD